MYAPNIPIHCSLAIKNLRSESLLFLFSKKDKSIFSDTFFKSSVFFCIFFTIHAISVKYTLISNYYKNPRRLKHMYLKYMPNNKTNKSVILTSITQRSLGKYRVSPGHSMLAHHKNAIDRDSDKNEDF